VGAELFHSDRRTDGLTYKHDETHSRFPGMGLKINRLCDNESYSVHPHAAMNTVTCCHNQRWVVEFMSSVVPMF